MTGVEVKNMWQKVTLRGDPNDITTAETVAAVSVIAGAWGAVLIPTSLTGPAAPVVAGALILAGTAYVVAKNPISTAKTIGGVFNFYRNMFPIISSDEAGKVTQGIISRGTENYRDLNVAIWGDMETTLRLLGFTVTTGKSGILPAGIGPKIFTWKNDMGSRYTNAIVGVKNNAGKEIPITVSESFNYSAFNKYVPEMPEVVEVRTNITNKYRSF